MPTLLTATAFFLLVYGDLWAENIVIQLAGDITLGGSCDEIFAQRGYTYAFNSVRKILGGAHINIANLEGPITERGQSADKQFVFRMKPIVARVLKEAGITGVTLANNHILDFGPEGLKDTITFLKKHSILFAGAGMNLAEARTPAFFDIQGTRIGLLSYSLTFPEEFYADESKAGTAPGWEAFLDEDIPRAKAKSDFLIVAFHWGQELMKGAKLYQAETAYRAIDLGADFVFGHHPHIPQPIDVYKNVPILYSLGNFVFGSYSKNVSDGLMARLTLAHKKLAGLEIIPINVNNYEVNCQPKVLSGQRAEVSLENLRLLSGRFATRWIKRGLVSLEEE